MSRASKAFYDFTGRKASRQFTAKLDDNNVNGWKIGNMVGVAYEATRDGKTDRYFHEFKKSARPNLVSRDDGKQLYITGGRYKVTDRGIEDMPQLFVVNPSSRRKAKRSKSMAGRTRRRRRTHHRRRSNVVVVRANPRRRRRARRSMFAMNPIRRRRRYRRNPVARRRYRRNPSGRMSAGVGKLSHLILPAAGIGAGAVASEIVMGYLPLPATLKTGVMRHVTKGGVGVVGGLVLGKLLRQQRLGKFFALGAIAIATHDAIKELIVARMPNVKFGAYLPAGATRGSLGYYNPAGTVHYGALGEYVPRVRGSLGGIPGV